MRAPRRFIRQRWCFHQPRSASSLLELVLVLIILAVIMSLAVPSLRGFRKGAKLRDAADQFMAVSRWARSQAITTAATHIIQIDTQSATYQVSVLEQGEVVPASGEFAQQITLPVGLGIDMWRSDGNASGAIEFHATARTSPAEVRIFDLESGSAVFLVAEVPTDPFRKMDSGAVRR
jgi:Tfp pilus assembly protein FimT